MMTPAVQHTVGVCNTQTHILFRTPDTRLTIHCLQSFPQTYQKQIDHATGNSFFACNNAYQGVIGVTPWGVQNSTDSLTAKWG
mmetsp:Transcript_32669/g.58597  ORF Transcript_32669/g.58597 Transcript_32669/m.58597 type:complete len:83 (+) Transcript_32669:61-309(+)